MIWFDKYLMGVYVLSTVFFAWRGIQFYRRLTWPSRITVIQQTIAAVLFIAGILLVLNQPNEAWLHAVGVACLHGAALFIWLMFHHLLFQTPLKQLWGAIGIQIVLILSCAALMLFGGAQIASFLFRPDRPMSAYDYAANIYGGAILNGQIVLVVCLFQRYFEEPKSPQVTARAKITYMAYVLSTVTGINNFIMLGVFHTRYAWFIPYVVVLNAALVWAITACSAIAILPKDLFARVTRPLIRWEEQRYLAGVEQLRFLHRHLIALTPSIQLGDDDPLRLMIEVRQARQLLWTNLAVHPANVRAEAHLLAGLLKKGQVFAHAGPHPRPPLNQTSTGYLLRLARALAREEKS